MGTIGQHGSISQKILEHAHPHHHNLTSQLGLVDHNNAALDANSSITQACAAGVASRLERKSTLPELWIDPLSPLPLADAARGGPAVRFVYFIMASRSYAHETINRNVMALQRPGALSDAGTNESNLFVLHADAKLSGDGLATLRAGVRPRPDVYFVRRPRHVMWAGWSMVLAHLDVMASVLTRKLHFEYIINLSDADLSLRTDAEIRAFFVGAPRRKSGRAIRPRNSAAQPPTAHATTAGFPGGRSCRSSSGSATRGGTRCTRSFASFAGRNARAAPPSWSPPRRASAPTR